MGLCKILGCEGTSPTSPSTITDGSRHANSLNGLSYLMFAESRRHYGERNMSTEIYLDLSDTSLLLKRKYISLLFPYSSRIRRAVA